MFGFHASAKDLEHQKCRRCNKKIGVIEHAPIPVCGPCWLSALDNRVSGPAYDDMRDAFHKIMRDFDAEARRWVRRMQTRPTRLDVLRDSNEGLDDVREMGRQIDAAYSRAKVSKSKADTDEAERIEETMRQRMEAISQNRPAALAAADVIEREE